MQLAAMMDGHISIPLKGTVHRPKYQKSIKHRKRFCQTGTAAIFIIPIPSFDLTYISASACHSDSVLYKFYILQYFIVRLL
jgi:hypothetical protein